MTPPHTLAPTLPNYLLDQSAPKPDLNVAPDRPVDQWVLALIASAIERLEPKPESVLNVEAGRAPSLEAEFASTVRYLATTSTDINQAAPLPQTIHHGTPSDLSAFRHDEFDLTVSFSALGWIADPETRRRSICEHLRVGKRTLLINYDWSVAEGGPAFNRLRDLISCTLSDAGFNPYYGLLQHREVALASQGKGRAITSPVAFDSSAFPNVIGGLAHDALTDQAGERCRFADRLIDSTTREIEAGVSCRLPDIVATLFT